MSQRQVQINAELARCALASDVLEIVRRSVEEFNVVNCGTALSRIARAPDGRRLVAREGSDPTLASLLAAAAGLVRHHARHVESRQLASLLHACGKLGVGKLEAADALVSAVERATEAHASKFNPQELANALWGCAKLGVRVDSALVRLLGDAAAASLRRGGSRDEKKAFDWRADWTAQGVSNAAWAFATLGASARDDGHETTLLCLFSAIETKARGGAFNAQETANALWAVARLAAAGADAEEEEANVAAGTDGQKNRGDVFDVFDSEALRSARAAASALAASTTGSWFERQRRGGGLESQHVANIAWACGKLGLASDARVAEAVAAAAAAAAPGANAQELSMIAWAMAEFPASAFAAGDHGERESGESGESAERTETETETNSRLRPVAASFASRAAEGVATPQQLATTARAFAKLGVLDSGLMDAIAEAVLALPGPLEDHVLPQDVANLLWAFAKLGLGEEETHVRAFGALAAAARARLRATRKALSEAPAKKEDETCSPEARNPSKKVSNEASIHPPANARVYSSRQLTTVVWSHGALASVKNVADAKTVDALVSAVRWALPELSARDLSDAAWAFAALGVTSAQKPKLVARMGRAARRRLEKFNAQELLKFLGAFERLGGSDSKLAEAAAKKRSTRYDFPALARVFSGDGRRGVSAENARRTPGDSAESAFCSVALASTTPRSFKGTSKEQSRVDDSCGGWGRGNTGVALWEGSFVLAEWLSRQTDPRRSKDVTAAAGEAWGGDDGWRGKTGVELGAGLGLPSIVASKLGVEMIATDGAFRFLCFFSPTATNAFRREVALVNPSAGPLRVLGVSRRAHMTP